MVFSAIRWQPNDLNCIIAISNKRAGLMARKIHIVHCCEHFFLHDIYNVKSDKLLNLLFELCNLKVSHALIFTGFSHEILGKKEFFPIQFLKFGFSDDFSFDFDAKW